MRALALSLLAATMASGCLATNRDAMIVFDVETFLELDRHYVVGCVYGTLRRVEFSRGDRLVFGQQLCGSGYSSTRIDWFVPGP